jgi:hypothetical protein
MPDPTCAIQDCDRKHRARGWCSTHYTRWLRTGDPRGNTNPDSPPIAGERWLPIPGWEELYEVSDHGRVRSLDRTITYSDGQTKRRKGTNLRVFITDKRRRTVSLSKHGQSQTHLVYRLVALAFLGPCPPGLEVCHGDGNPANNHTGNLRYDTPSNNQLDSVRHGTHRQTSKTHCSRNHLLTAPNLTARSIRQGHRICLACTRAGHYVYRAKQVGHPHDFNTLADRYYQRIMQQTS